MVGDLEHADMAVGIEPGLLVVLGVPHEEDGGRAKIDTKANRAVVRIVRARGGPPWRHDGRERQVRRRCKRHSGVLRIDDPEARPTTLAGPVRASHLGLAGVPPIVHVGAFLLRLQIVRERVANAGV